MTARLPVIGGDDNDWGAILNGFLQVAHNGDGTIQTGAPNGVAGLNSSSLVPTGQLGTGTASTSNFLRGDGMWAVPAGGGSGVTSFNGRTGVVAPQSGDYTAAEVSALPSTNDLSAIASANATAGNVSMNSHKVTNVANGIVGSDAAAYGQTPAGGNTVTIGQGGTGQVTQQAALNTLAGAMTAGHVLRGDGTNVTLAALQSGDIPNNAANTSGNAATATNLAGGATLPGYVAPRVVTLTDGSSVSIDASQGNDFRWTLGGSSHTLAVPSNPVNGQAITIAIKYSGSFTPLFNAVFDFGSAGQAAWTATLGKTDYAGFRYDAALNGGVGSWAYQGSVLGLTS